MPPIPPFVLAALAMLLRQGLLMLAGALGLTPLIQPLIDDYLSPNSQFLTGLAGAVAVIGYAFWVKIREKQKLLTATSAANLTEAKVEAMVQSDLTPTPSVNTPKHAIPQ